MDVFEEDIDVFCAFLEVFSCRGEDEFLKGMFFFEVDKGGGCLFLL